MNRILIIDGHNLLFQMFFGMPSRIVGHGGVAIQGVIGFIGAVGKLTAMVRPTHLAVIFDGERENPRKEILEEYKANRIDYSTVPNEENPFTQLPYIFEALDLIGIPYSKTTVCETDDVIAGYAMAYGGENEVVISSFDSDFFQLINDRVSVIRYRGDSSIRCDAEYVEKKYGIPPSLYLDYKCLVGDTADNITGIRGVGPKTAAKLLNSFGSLDAILERHDMIDNEKLRSSISDGKELLMRNLSLIKLNGEAELPFTLDEIIYEPTGFRTMDIMRRLGLI